LQKYYRTPVDQIEDRLLRQVFDDLVVCVGWTPPVDYNLQVYKWFLRLFQSFKGSDFTHDNFVPGSPLVTKLNKLRGTEVFVLCQEIEKERPAFRLEKYENGTLLSYLKKVYTSPEGRLRSRSRGY
jgi:hypothetical protein